MVSSPAPTVASYLRGLPPDRRRAIEGVLAVVRKALPPGYEEGMQYGMIGWYVPLSRYPDTYNGAPLAIAGLASQKQYMSLYLMGAYGDPKIQRWFEKAYRASGKKLDMGKSCVRFRSLDDLPLDVIAEVIARVPVDEFLTMYEASRKKTTKKKTAKKKTAKKKTAKKKTAKKKTAKKKTAKKKTAKKKAAKKRR